MTKLAEKLRTDPLYVARAGRVSYYVDFQSAESDYVRGSERKKVNEGANCWSSECRLLPDLHMPCFDVDVDRSKIIRVPTDTEHIFLWNTVEDTVNEWMRRLCKADVEVRWVPSTTPGHHHVYVDYPIEWTAYVAVLGGLETYGIIERGYLYASKARKATYVRMPGVLKAPPRYPPAPSEQLNPMLDMEPF